MTTDSEIIERDLQEHVTKDTPTIGLNARREKKARVDADRVAELQKAQVEEAAQAEKRKRDRIRFAMHQAFPPMTLGAAISTLEDWKKLQTNLPTSSKILQGQAGLDKIVLRVLDGLQMIAENENAANANVRNIVREVLKETAPAQPAD